MVESGEAGGEHLERAEHVLDLLVLVLLGVLLGFDLRINRLTLFSENRLTLFSKNQLTLFSKIRSCNAFCTPLYLLHLDISYLVACSLSEDPKGQIEVLGGSNQLGKDNKVEGKGEYEAGQSTNDQPKRVGVVFVVVREKNWIALNCSDTVGIGHLEPDGEDHDEEGGGEDDSAGQTLGTLLSDSNFVDEPIEKEADDESNGRRDEDAVENLVNAAAIERVWVAGVDSVKTFLRAKDEKVQKTA